MTLLTALIAPPGQSPDEEMHYARALGLLHGAVLPERHLVPDIVNGKTEWHAGVKVDYGLLSACFDNTSLLYGHNVETIINHLVMQETKPQHVMNFVNMPNTATYFPAAYVPATLGVAAAGLFGATPYQSFYTARIFMAVAYLALSWAAIYVAAYGEAVLVTVLLLPMTAFLGGTMNQDGVLMAMICLSLAALTQPGRGARLAGLVLFALVLGAKPPYILLLGVFALPLFAPGFWGRFRDMLVALVPVLGWILYISLFVVVAYGKVPYYPGPLYTGDHSIQLDHADAAAQWHILMQRPQRFLALPYYYTMQAGYVLYITAIGVLGPLQIILPPALYNSWGACLVFALFGLLLTRRPAFVPPRQAAWNFLAVMAAISVTYWLILITFYLDWTNVGMPLIDGIQGRYLLPFLPFVLFAVPHLQSLPGLRRVQFSLPPLLLALPSLAVGFYDAGYIPLTLAQHYYMH